MSRPKIGLVVAVVVGLLTAIAYKFTTSSLEDRIRGDVEAQVARSRDLLWKNASFDALDLIKRVETFARDDRAIEALALPTPAEQKSLAVERLGAMLGDHATTRQSREVAQRGPKVEFLALVSGEGTLIATAPSADYQPDWKQRYPAVASALDKPYRAYKDVWDLDGALFDIGAAPLVDKTTGDLRGVIVAAFNLDDRNAAEQAALLGAEVAYFDATKIRASRMNHPDVAKRLLYEGTLAKEVLAGQAGGIQRLTTGGHSYVAATTALPMNISGRPIGAMVLVSLDGALEPVASVQLAIVLLGLGALVIALLAMMVTARMILAPAEEIEQGIAEIINGDVDYTFKPAGVDFDGLANALNVMLARLLGRAEPSEDDLGDASEEPGTGARVILADDGGLTATPVGGPTVTADPALIALAAEPEQDYYRRIFDEYAAAKTALGESVEGIVYEAFVAKLRLNEANLKKKYDSRAVRFRVQTRDGQVTLKPVPIR